MIKCYTNSYHMAGTTVYDNETGEIMQVLGCRKVYADGTVKYLITLEAGVKND